MKVKVSAFLLTLPALVFSSGLQAQDGSIKGTVSFGKPVPAAEQLTVTSDEAVCGQTVASKSVLVKAGKVQYAVVYLEGATGTRRPGASPTVSNHGCVFDPPVLAATVGDTVTISNGDEVLHNTHMYLTQRTVVNLALPTKGMQIRNARVAARAGLVDIKCDAHDWMQAKLWVFETPYWAVTAADGSFEITGVPPGKYTLKVWHEKLGEQTREITVASGAAATANVGL